MNGFYTWVVGWTIILALFIGSTRYEGSRTITYYVLWLSIVLILVTHAGELTTLLRGTGIQGISDATEGSGQATRQSSTSGDQILTAQL